MSGGSSLKNQIAILVALADGPQNREAIRRAIGWLPGAGQAVDRRAAEDAGRWADRVRDPRGRRDLADPSGSVDLPRMPGPGSRRKNRHRRLNRAE